MRSGVTSVVLSITYTLSGGGYKNKKLEKPHPLLYPSSGRDFILICIPSELVPIYEEAELKQSMTCFLLFTHLLNVMLVTFCPDYLLAQLVRLKEVKLMTNWLFTFKRMSLRMLLIWDSSCITGNDWKHVFSKQLKLMFLHIN